MRWTIGSRTQPCGGTLPMLNVGLAAAIIWLNKVFDISSFS